MARNFVSGFLSMIGARMATFATMFVATPLIVRLLGPEGYGNYAFALSAFSLLMVFVSSGVSEGVQKYVGETERWTDWREHVVAFYLRLALLTALAGSLIFVVGVWSGVLEGLLGQEFALVFYLLAAFVVAAQLREFAIRALRGFGVERYSESLRAIHAPLFAATGIGLVALGYGVPGMLVGHLLGSLFVAVAGFILISRRVDLTTALSRGTTDVPQRELLSFNLMNVLLMLLMMSLYHVDVLMIRVIESSEATAYYKAALAVAEFMWFVPTALQSMFLHSTSSLWSSGDTDAIDSIASRTTRYAILFSALLAVGIAALGSRFLPLYYGPQYSQALLPLLVLLPGAMGFAIARPIYGIAQGKGNLKPMVLATGGAATVNAVLNALLIPRFGMVGAAAATSAGYLSMLAFHVWSAHRLGFHPLADTRLHRVVATVGLGGVPLLFLAPRIGNDILAFAIIPPLGAILFFTFAVATGALDRDELGEIVDSMPEPIRNVVESIRRHLPEPLARTTIPGR